MPYYFMRDTPLQALEQLMMSQPGQKPRGGGIYRSPFHYTPKDVACEYCQNYVRKHPCRLCECTCLDERIEAGVLEVNEFVRECFAPSMGPQFRIRMHQQLRERNPQFFLSDAHRRRWTHWRERCWRLSDRNKAALYLLTAYESLWRRMVWKCGNDGFDFQSVRLGGIEPELYSVYQAAKAIAVGCCNITLADLASPELVTDEAFHLIIGALLMAKYFLKQNLVGVHIQNAPWKDRAFQLWSASWRFILGRKDDCLFYLRYYYSANCRTYAYEEHLQCFQELFAAVEQTFKPEANVNMLLHQVFDTMLSFAARVLGGEMPDDDATTQWAFEQIYSFVVPNVREELLISAGSTPT